MSTPLLHQPRLAEMISDLLRQRIVRGELPEGASLPKQEDLIVEFGVSQPTLREAMRILESEGLVEVRKGPVGGAVVRVPKPITAAYTIALVLQLQSVQMDDLADCINQLEPNCAALCAGRSDRDSAVVPVLRDLNERSLAALDDRVELTRLTRRFHEQLVALCGNSTLTLVLGSLESLWSAQENAWADESAGADHFPRRDQRARAVDAHVRLTELIAAGYADQARQAAHAHLQHRLYAGGGVIDAGRLRTAARTSRSASASKEFQ